MVATSPDFKTDDKTGIGTPQVQLIQNELLTSNLVEEESLHPGVLCILLIERNGEHLYVATTLPTEDFETRKKVERAVAIHMGIQQVMMGTMMSLSDDNLSFPSGAVSVGSSSTILEMIREISEELGIQVAAERLSLLSEKIRVDQEVEGDEEDPLRNGTRSYEVQVFTLTLSEEELTTLNENMRHQKREVILIAPSEVGGYLDRLRPASAAALEIF